MCGRCVCVCVVVCLCVLLLFFGLFQTNANANAILASSAFTLPLQPVYLSLSLAPSGCHPTPLIWKIHLSTLPKDATWPSAPSAWSRSSASECQTDFSFVVAHASVCHVLLHNCTTGQAAEIFPASILPPPLIPHVFFNDPRAAIATTTMKSSSSGCDLTRRLKRLRDMQPGLLRVLLQY